MEDESTSQPIDEVEQSEETTDEQATEEVVDEQVEEVEEQAVAEPEEQVEEQPQEEAPPVSRRENLRIQQLVQKMQQPAPEPPRQTQAGLDYRTALNADDETYKTLEQDRQSFGETQYNQGVKQAETIQFHTRLEIDAPKVASKYEQLDKDSPNFNPAVAGAINEMYLATTGYDAAKNTVQNSTVRYADYVDAFMEMVEETAGQKVQKATKNIAKQAATTSVRPDGSRPKRMNLNQLPNEMSDEELDAAIKLTLPTK
jgi:hypothetical protein